MPQDLHTEKARTMLNVFVLFVCLHARRCGYICPVEAVHVAKVSDDDTEVTQLCQCGEANED
jgi:hypothetical protein